MQNQQPSQRPTMKDSFNVVMLFANAHAICLTPFLHRGFGVRYPGMAGLWAAVMICVAMGISGDPAFMPVLCLWAVALACQRSYALKVRSQGVVQHSFYDGTPWLAMKLPFMKSERTARLAEVMYCLAGGGALAAAGAHGLGPFLMLGCFSLPLVEGMKRQLRYQQVLSAQDAMLEMQMHQERVGGLRDDF